MKFAVPFILCAALVAGCAHNDSPYVQEQDLLHRNFILTHVDGKPIHDTTKDSRPLNIEFGENMHINGAMCNNFTGNATLKDGVLTAQHLASTRMACFDEQLNELDRIIADMLSDGATVDLTENKLTLSTSKHNLTYQLRDWIR